MMTFFDPANKYFRSFRGAAAAGTSLRLRVVLPRNFGVRYCFLVITADDREPFYIAMTWEATDGETESWITEYTPDRPALLFYHFQYENAWGKTELKHAPSSLLGEIRGALPWQLTVYDPAFRTPDRFKGGIIYQIFPDRFYNSGTEKQNVPSDRILRNDTDALPYWRPDAKGEIRNNDYFGGDFRGITEKLGYIASLGTTCIYLNPVCEAHSNHRYNTADYRKPDPLLGTEEDFSLLCRKAHELGMAVILDGVFSHTGDDSIYFNKYKRYGDGGAYNDDASPYRAWYTFKKNRDDYDCWWNISTLPEVREEDGSYLDFITGEDGVIAHWLSLGADGFRLDVADELPDVFLDRVRTAVKRAGEEYYLLGEVWEDATNKISHGGRRRFLLGRQLDGVMNYPFRKAILSFLLDGNAERFMRGICSVTDNYPKEALDISMNHLGTHDTERVLTVLSGIRCEGMTREQQANISIPHEVYEHAVRLMKMAVFINYCLPGIPSVYYGDEAGMTGAKDPFNRACYPWGRENTELLGFMRFAGELRRNAPVLKKGGFYPLSAALGCAAFLRYEPGLPRIALIANKNTEEITYMLNPDMADMRPLTGEKKIPGGIVIPPETAVILSDF